MRFIISIVFCHTIFLDELRKQDSLGKTCHYVYTDAGVNNTSVIFLISTFFHE